MRLHCAGGFLLGATLILVVLVQVPGAASHAETTKASVKVFDSHARLKEYMKSQFKANGTMWFLVKHYYRIPIIYDAIMDDYFGKSLEFVAPELDNLEVVGWDTTSEKAKVLMMDTLNSKSLQNKTMIQAFFKRVATALQIFGTGRPAIGLYVLHPKLPAPVDVDGTVNVNVDVTKKSTDVQIDRYYYRGPWHDRGPFLEFLNSYVGHHISENDLPTLPPSHPLFCCADAEGDDACHENEPPSYGSWVSPVAANATLLERAVSVVEAIYFGPSSRVLYRNSGYWRNSTDGEFTTSDQDAAPQSVTIRKIFDVRMILATIFLIVYLYTRSYEAFRWIFV